MQEAQQQWEKLRAWAPKGGAAQRAAGGAAAGAGGLSKAAVVAAGVELPRQRMNVDEAVLATCGLDPERDRQLLDRRAAALVLF